MQLLAGSNAVIPKDSHKLSGSTGVKISYIQGPLHKWPWILEGSAAGSSAAVEKPLKSLKGSSEGSIEGGAERGLLMGIGNLTTKEKQARRRN